MSAEAMLTDGQLGALRNLSRKKAGAEVGFVGIADARSLTDLGYAVRTRSGWEITAAGEALLDQSGPADPESKGATLPFPGP